MTIPSCRNRGIRPIKPLTAESRKDEQAEKEEESRVAEEEIGGTARHGSEREENKEKEREMVDPVGSAFVGSTAHGD